MKIQKNSGSESRQSKGRINKSIPCQLVIKYPTSFPLCLSCLLRSCTRTFFTSGTYSYHQVFKVGTFCIVRRFITYFPSQTPFPPNLWASTRASTNYSIQLYVFKPNFYTGEILGSRRTMLNCCSQHNHYRETKLLKRKHIKLMCQRQYYYCLD